MPLYDFKCKKCEETVESFRHVSTIDDPEMCPKCGEEMARLFPKGTHAVIDGTMDSRPRGMVIQEKNEKLKAMHSGYSHESHNLREKINKQSQALFGTSEGR